MTVYSLNFLSILGEKLDAQFLRNSKKKMFFLIYTGTSVNNFLLVNSLDLTTLEISVTIAHRQKISDQPPLNKK